VVVSDARAANIAQVINAELSGNQLRVACDVANPNHTTNRRVHHMKMPAPPTDGHFEPCPAGNHFAVCSRLIDLGTQETHFQGQPKRQRKIYVEFQIPTERTSEGDPVTVGIRYTFSSSEKATLRKHLESWRGRKFTDDEIAGFDLRAILSKPACLNVVHSERSGNTYSDIASIGSLPKGTTPPTLEGDPVYLSLDPEDFEPATFESLSEKLRETIASSPEYKALREGEPSTDARAGDGRTAAHAYGDEEIPF
jgi:hypothetical protein